MRISDLTKDLDHVSIIGDGETDIKGISYDSRHIDRGFVFVCIKGYKVDGHEYINDAFSKGAVAVVVEDDTKIPDGMTIIRVADTRLALALMSAAFFGYPTRDLKLIGVTGTNGKTTTTYLIKSILEEYGRNTALLGTISNIVGGSVVESRRTTPESYDLQHMFSEMRDCNTEYCVMEVSSHSLELNRVAGCNFNTAIFTNLTRDHLDFHGTFENYFSAKLKLFKQCGRAVVNIDDSYSQRIIDSIDVPVVSYSEKSSGDVTAKDVEITAMYSKFTMEYRGDSVYVKLPLPGRFNVYNALASAAACLCEGIPLDIIKRGLENVKGVAGRSEAIDSGRGFIVIIDYAHTPDGLENILTTVREYAEGRIITVFGCGGDRDKTKRPLMGETVGRLSDISIVTSDNPRTEDPMSIIHDILPGISKITGSYEVVADRRCAIERALCIAQPGDVVVIAGKGHETYQELGDRKIHFDEREIVNSILNVI